MNRVEIDGQVCKIRRGPKYLRLEIDHVDTIGGGRSRYGGTSPVRVIGRVLVRGVTFDANLIQTTITEGAIVRVTGSLRQDEYAPECAICGQPVANRSIEVKLDGIQILRPGASESEADE